MFKSLVNLSPAPFGFLSIASYIPLSASPANPVNAKPANAKPTNAKPTNAKLATSIRYYKYEF